MIRKIREIYRGLPLRRKQLALFLLWGIACVIPISVIAGIMLNQILIRQRRNELRHSLDQASEQLEAEISRYNALSDYIFNDDDITAVFSEEYTDNYYTMYIALEHSVMPTVLTYRLLDANLNYIRFYTDNGLPYYKSTVFPLETLQNSSWFSDIGDSYQTTWIIRGSGGYQEIAAVRKIFLQGSDFTCYLMLQPAFNAFLAPLTSMLSDGNAVWLTQTDQDSGEVLFYENRYIEEDDPLVARLTVTEDLSNGWTIHYGMSRDKFNRTFFSMLIMIIAIAAAVVGAMMIGLFFIADTIIRPVVKLTSRLTNRIQQHSRKPLYTSRTDEVGQLTNSFNTLIRDVYESRLEADEYHLKVLYAQINPHFLYNALGAINNKAILAGQDDISRMTLLLSDFYRTSLNHGNEMTTISDELKNIRSYIEIEQILYGDFFKVSWQIADGPGDREMPNFILQPIVENAINHGLRNSPRPDRLLSISLTLKGTEAVFTIADNGTGIPADILATLKAHESSGIGLSNIDKRLMLCFGEDYGLGIESSEGVGTTVTVRIPEKPSQTESRR